MMKWMLAFWLCAAMGCQTTQSAWMAQPPNWEYRVQQIDVPGKMTKEEPVVEFLNEMARHGWELVEIYGADQTKPYGVFRRRSEPIKVIYDSQTGNTP